MAIQTIVNDINFFNEFKNDIGFVSNLTDNTNNLAGTIMGNMLMTMDVDISWQVTYAPAGGFNWTLSIPGGFGTQLTIVSNDGYDFNNEGFSSGDIVDIGVNIGGTPFGAANNTVTFVNGNTMVVQLSSAFFLPTGVIGIAIAGKSWLTALNYKFGLIENNETFNTLSKVSGNDQGYYAGGIGADIGGGVRSTSFVDMIKLGSYNDWLTGSCRVKFVSNPTTYQQRFVIEHRFTVVPFYLEGQLFNLENLVLPTLYNGINTLKYVFNAGFRTVLSNPNTEKKFQIDNINGSVAWFNENFNGFQNDYNIKSVTYQEAGSLAAADGILAGSQSRITILVERLSTPFVAGDRFGAYISYLPTEAEYTDTVLSNLKENFIYDRAINNEGIASTTGDDFITLCEGNLVGSDLEIVIEMEYSILQKTFLANKIAAGDTKYLIGIEVGDNTLSSAASNKVMLLADVNNYDLSADIPDLMNFDKYDIFPHNKQIGVDAGFTDMNTWNEDGLVVDFDFYLDRNKDAVINDLIFKLVAHNPITGQLFELDTYTYNNIGSAIISGTIQQLNQSTTRNYNLAPADQFNDVTIETGVNVGGLQHYTGRFAQKITWQDWIQNTDVDTIFYDVTKPNSNLNDRASNYSFLNDYEIKLAVASNLSGTSDLGVSGVTDYLFLSPAITVNDYDEDQIPLVNVWSGVIETFHPDTLADLGGKVLTGIDTIMKTTWTNAGGPVLDISQVWAIHRIEETNQLGFNIDELSSINDYPVPNRLKPLSGETQLKIYLDSGNVITECLVDGSQITAGIGYNLSARINDDVVYVDSKPKLTSPDNTVKDTSGTIETKIEAP